MSQKQALLARIDSLLLLTEENKQRMREILGKADTSKDIELIEQFLDQEEALIHETLTRIFEEELNAGHREILEGLEKALMNSKKADREVSKIGESDERTEAKERAEKLLSDL